MILEYNKKKCGVDTVDQMITHYSTKMASRRWPLAVFCNIIDIDSDDSNTYIWDLETYKYMNSKNEKNNRPYACACINLRKFNNMIKDDINNENNLSEKKLNKLLKAVHVFINKDCIDQMFQFFGTLSKKKITLIAHNGSGFDNFFVLRNKNMILDKPPLKTSRGILSAKVKNLYTNENISNKWF